VNHVGIFVIPACFGVFAFLETRRLRVEMLGGLFVGVPPIPAWLLAPAPRRYRLDRCLRLVGHQALRLRLEERDAVSDGI